ncbi:MAG: chemotaxis protein CheC [Sulfurimonas sp.]|nr:chemotaxis protein CheC [Sulfurimonas sp.]
MNLEKITFNDDEKDVLQELINIAYGNATAIVADILDAFASLSVPIIEVMTINELLFKFNNFKHSSYFFSTQAFIGDFSGECAFFINEESANNLAKHLDIDNVADLDDAILELTNILTSSLTMRLAQEMHTEVTYSLPNISKIPLSELSNSKTLQYYSQVIVIDTKLNFKEQHIDGQIFILTKDGSMQWLKKQLNIILKSLI